MYRITWGCLAIFFLAAIGCSSGSTTDGQTTSKFLSLGTAPPGGAFFVVGSAVAEVLNENSGTRGWEFSAEATKGSQENIRRLVRHELDLALSNSSITYFGVRGEEGWDQEYPVRTVMTLAPNIALFVTPASSGITKLSDLRGKRVVVGVAGAGFEFFVRPLLLAHGITYDDFSPLYNTQAGSVDMLADGSAAAAFLGGAVPTASITQASASQDIFFIPYGEAEKEELVKTYPFFEPAVIPAGTYRGQEEDFNGLNVGSMHLITAADQSEDLIYELTKAIYENREALAAKHPAGRAVNPANVIRNTGTPFHPGAVRYYKELGIWPAQ
jgi:TRAP transporter TAXI family solute receptor